MRMSNPHKLGGIEIDRAASRRQKKAVNLSINRDLLDRARDGDLNLSSILEVALQRELQQRERERWLTENRAAMEMYNEQVEKEGVFSDGLRAF